jgi:predicted lipoprotein with Yx(FWY)xxD motif
MTRRSPLLVRLCGVILAGTAWPIAGVHAQPADLPVAPATTSNYPPGVKVLKLPSGAVYANKKGLTLYGMDMRTVLRAGPDPALYCTGRCAEEWEPLLAPEKATPNIKFPAAFGRGGGLAPGFIQPQSAPDWTIIQGVNGPQWVYKGWHLVFVRKGDKKGSTSFEGADGKIWNTLKFIPPVPDIIAPRLVRPVFTDGNYVLSDDKGRSLFTGQCSSGCSEWVPFGGGMASAAIGEWRVEIGGDVPQWHYRNSPVFISLDGSNVPEGGKALKP